MQKSIFRLMVLVAMLLLCSPVLLANAVDQDVVITVDSYSTLSLQDAQVAIECTNEGSFSTGFSHYKVSSNNTNTKKISAIISSFSAAGQPAVTDVPAGMTIKASLDAYSTGTAEGQKTLLKASSVDLVTGLPSSSSAFGEAGWIDVDYTVDITEAVGPDVYTATVTYTLAEV